MLGPREVGVRDHALGACLAAVYLAILLCTTAGLAMSRDESFYVSAAESYGGWFRQVMDAPKEAFTQRAIDRAWSNNHEHPALVKTLFAWSWLAQERFHLFEQASTAYRFPGMLTAALLLWVIYIFGARTFGRRAGLFAALAFALLPRIFYHAHLDCFDVPIALALTVVTYCYWRSLDSWVWVVWTGLTYGLALATKHNAWILPGVLLIHWVWLRASARETLPKQARLPWWLLSMAVLGPPIFVGSWPWLWHDAVKRFGAYAAFHMHHDYYNMAYFGVNYFKPPFPVSYPWMMTLFTVPFVVLLLGAVGLVARWRTLIPRWASDFRCTEVLWLGCFIAPLFVISLPSTPIFGGTKHWFPAYPFLALFAGVGFAKLTDGLRAIMPTVPAAMDYAVATAAGAVLLLPSAIETAHSNNFGLSHYTVAAGGVPGAADYGMNRQFWGFTQGSLAAWFTANMPQGGTVWLCDATAGSWAMMQRDGMIPKNIRATGNLAQADYALVHHEMHFAEVDFQIWEAFGTAAPVKVLTYDGVPIVSVYKNPRR